MVESRQPANKILVIGGSTYNPCTPCKIRDALAATNFLEEWAIIFANHGYFRLHHDKYDKNAYELKTYWEFQGANVVLIQELKSYLVEKNNIYVLPDPSPSDWTVAFQSWIVTFTTQQGSPVIKVSNLQTVKDREWLEELELPEGFAPSLYNLEDYDASPALRTYQPCIDKVMIEVARSNLSQKAGLILCGKDGDGAYGLREIKANDGETAVQIPCECQKPNVTDSMPNTALKLEPNHHKVSLENPHSPCTLTNWLRLINK